MTMKRRCLKKCVMLLVVSAVMALGAMPVWAGASELEEIYWRMSQCPVIQSLPLDEALGQFGEVPGFSFNWSLLIYSGSPAINITPVESPTGGVALSVTDRPTDYYTLDARLAYSGIVSGEFTLTASGRVSSPTQVLFTQTGSPWHWLTDPMQTTDDDTFEITYAFTLPLEVGQHGIRITFMDDVDFILDELVLEGMGTTIPVQPPMFPPTDITVDRETGRVSWGEVEGAEEYWILVNGEFVGWVIDEYFYFQWVIYPLIHIIEVPETFHLQIQAGRECINTGFILGTPRSRPLELTADNLDVPVLRIVDNNLEWDIVSGAYYMTMYLDGVPFMGSIPADLPGICLHCFVEIFEIEPGTYTIQMRAVSYGIGFSILSDALEVELS